MHLKIFDIFKNEKYYTFVTCHGCGNCYIDGTNEIVPKGRRCIKSTYNPFCKTLIDVLNRVQLRVQIKLKPKANRNFVRRYQKYLRVFSTSKPYSNSDDLYSSPSEDESDNESTTCNASIAEHNLSDRELNTGENLTIDENIKNELEHEHPLSCSCTETQAFNNTEIQTTKMRNFNKKQKQIQ